MEAPEGTNNETELFLVSSDGERRSAILDASAQPARVRVESVAHPGLYRFEADGTVFATVAVNVDRSESRREWWTPDDFAGVFGAEDSPLHFASLDGDVVGDALATARQGRPLHPLLLTLAAILMVIESFLARRLGSARKPA